MRNTILCALLILTTISCASLMDFDGVYRSDGSAVVDPDPYDPSLDLLLGLYAYSLIAAPRYRTYQSYNYLPYYLPPPASLSPIYKSLWIQSEIENNLRNYEYRLQSINDMETWKLKMDVQRIIDDLKRAKEEAEEKD